jgi:TolB-like protein/DNA-binding winged helix-turn-helix (wHTH) protein
MTAVPGDANGGDPGRNASRARFGTFELDLRTLELRREGTRIKLQDQPLRLLTILIQRPGEVVTREELRQQLWAEEFVDFDHGLNTAVRKLRSALNDDADNPRFVETLARRGYRFLAPVTWEGDAGPPPPPPAPPLETVPRRRMPLILTLAALVIVAAVAGVLFTRSRSPGRSATVDSIAILPFRVQSADDEHLGDGLTEILITRLSRLPALRVMARDTVFSFKGGKVPAARAGREMQVNAVVTGNVRREGDTYSILVELIDVEDGAQLWGDRYATSLAELPRTQSRIVEDLSMQLRHGATQAQRQSASRAYTTNAAAYQQYLLGLQAWNRRTRADLPKAEEHFQRAIALDPQFAAAYAGLANTYGVMIGNSTLTPAEGTIKVFAAARKALEIDPENAEAHSSIAASSFRNLWDFQEAERSWRRAIELEPSYATAHHWYAGYLMTMGRYAEGRREAELGYRLDPLSVASISSQCWSLYLERRYRDTLAFAEKALEVQPTLSPHCQGSTYRALGDYEGLLRLLESRKLPHWEKARAAYERDGPAGLARLHLELLQPNAERFPVDMAVEYALLGDADQAFAWLEKGYQNRLSRTVSFHVYPSLDPIRDDPRFADLARRIGLPPSALEAARELARKAPHAKVGR